MAMLPRRHALALAGGASLAAGVRTARAATSGDKLRIGVLGDQSGITSAPGGLGAVAAVRMAVADFGGRAVGRAIEVIDADCKLKPDIAAQIAGRWYDEDAVDVIVDLPQTAVALAVIDVARRRGRSTIVSGATASAITGAQCAEFNVHWVDDTFALANVTGRAIVADGKKDWFFITADYTFGHELQQQATDAIVATGGKVLGSARHPFGNADFSSFLLEAQTSGAQVVALANVGSDLITAIKQSHEFGLASGGRQIVGLLVFINDIHALGLDVAQGMYVTSGFYWDQNDESRRFAKRFGEATGAMPSKEQASAYASTLHFLRVVEA
ncbi:MAG: ABC transporter substrate-binding protein, partial [Rhodopila sp.]|nr:ABC transporter substrate-binding protein [Rhodopila sp.]